MGKAEKKHGKGRLDEYYHKAKQKGYRARSSFKILQINEEFGHFLERSKVVIDLCAAPGSWCQVAIQKCPIGSLIIGVDLAPIKPLPNVITFQSDITTEHCRTTLKKHMKHAKADTVMHDGAPNVGLAWGQDAYTQSELTLQSLKLAVEFLVPGGTFVTKIFRSRDYNKMFWVMQQMFGHVKAYKPKSSRNVSAEVFLVCQNFKNAKIDPKMLDSKYVFEELEEATPNYNAKVFNPDKKRRHRDGYEENETHFHEMTAMEFIKHEDPIKCLGSMNRIVFDTEAEPELKAIKKLSKINDKTNELDKTSELLRCFDDLKILGKKEFRNILKWRKNMREYLKLDGDDDDGEQVEVAELDEDEKITQELSEIQERERLKRKRTKRKANETKQKEILKRQLNMTTPTELGMEAGVNGDSLFNLRKAEKTGELSALIKGKKAMVFDEKDNDDVVVSENEGDQDSDAYAENLETELDSMYDALKERRAARDAKFRAKMNRERSTVEDDEFTGFSERDDSDSEDVREDESDSGLDTEDEEDLDKLITNLRTEQTDLSGKAKRFFDNPLFQDAGDDDESDDDVVVKDAKSTQSSKPEPMDVDEMEEDDEQSTTQSASDADSDTEDSEDDFEIVANDAESDDDWEYRNNDKTQRQTVDIATAEAMTMAHDLALGKNKHKWMNEAGFNKYSFRDTDGLPQWFLDDERRHNKITRPVTKEAVEALRQKQKTMNARPIKKVAEAQARKKYKAQQRLEKIRKKSDLIIDDANKSEREKADEVQRLIKKLGKKQIKKPKVTLIAAKGSNRAVQGRPKGVKGKYKMVDGTMKKEQRALKRIAKKRK